MSDINFNAEAEQILKELQQLLDEDDKAIFNNQLRSVCNEFKIFYDNYFQEENRSKEGLKIHRHQLQELINVDDEANNSYAMKKSTQSVATIVSTLVNASRKLESLLTGFKAVFLKTIGQGFVQKIVVETEDLQPVIIQLQGFDAMQNFIKGSSSDFQGKLSSNIKMLELINSKNQSNAKFYNVNEIDKSYINTYRESRRRLNIFYNRIKKGQQHGEGLLFYKPKNRWIKFYVSSLGDLKEGLVSMVTNQEELGNNIELNIEAFTKYIGKVDNIAGSLLQDIQDLQNNLQISVKSGSAQTGSHEQLINLIKLIADSGNIESIREFYDRDLKKSQAESGQRNRIYSNKQSVNKIAMMMSNKSRKEAEKALAEGLLDVAAASRNLRLVTSDLNKSLKS